MTIQIDKIEKKKEVWTLVAREGNIRWQHVILNSIIHIVQFNKEDCTILHMCWAVESYLSPVPIK